MKKVVLTLSILSSLNTYATDPNITLAQIQDQINALNAKLATPTSTLPPTIGTDMERPFGYMSKVEMPIQLLKARSQLNNPIVIGGKVEGDLQATNGNSIPLTTGGTYQEGSDVALGAISLMTMANINPETIAFTNIVLDRPNYNINLERAFVVFGNLAQNPFSLMTGIGYLPFGNFVGNGPWSNALTTNLFRVNTTNQVVANYTNAWLILNAGIYNTTKNTDIDYLFTGVAQTTWHELGMSLGASYLSDIRGTDSGLGNAYAMQNPPSATQPLSGGPNGAVDLNASLGPEYFTLLAEYATTLHGATETGQNVAAMNAWMLGERSKFKVYQLPIVFQLSYSASDNMSAVTMIYNADIPQALKTAVGIEHQWLTSAVAEFWKNVWVGPEFVTAKLYTGQYSYTGTLDMTAYF